MINHELVWHNFSKARIDARSVEYLASDPTDFCDEAWYLLTRGGSRFESV